jgi:hypothetical protein
MPLYAGELRIAKAYKGGDPIARIYKGSALIFASAYEIYSDAMTADSNGWGGWTIRSRIDAAVLDAPPFSSAKLRVGVAASSIRNLQFSAFYVGHRAASGNAWDTASLTQVLWSGSAGATIPSGAIGVSDWTDFAWNKTSDLIFSFFVSGNSSNDGARRVADGSNRHIYWKNANEANQNTPSGFASASTFQVGIAFIEVR